MRKFQNNRASSIQSAMATGGQCCLARPLPAHDACALLLSNLRLSGHRRLRVYLGCHSYSLTGPAACGWPRHNVHQSKRRHLSPLIKAHYADSWISLRMYTWHSWLQFMHAAAKGGRAACYLVFCMVCILLSLSTWLLLRCPALCTGLVSWADPLQRLHHRAGVFPSSAAIGSWKSAVHLHVEGETTSGWCVARSSSSLVNYSTPGYDGPEEWRWAAAHAAEGAWSVQGCSGCVAVWIC